MRVHITSLVYDVILATNFYILLELELKMSDIQNEQLDILYRGLVSEADR